MPLAVGAVSATASMVGSLDNDVEIVISYSHPNTVPTHLACGLKPLALM
jgi:hypothetical protein